MITSNHHHQTIIKLIFLLCFSLLEMDNIKLMGIQAKNIQKEESVHNQDNGPSSIIKSQIFRAWLPVPSLNKTIILFFVISVIFIVLGIPMIILSRQIIEYQVKYDEICEGSSCIVSFRIAQDMEGPVYVYYQLQRYYQNHRMYASSVSEQQLIGNYQSVSQISSVCHPIVTNGDLYVKVAIDGTPLNPNQPANPCGIIAYSFFNDSFTFLSPNGTGIAVSTDGIAWASDVSKYKNSNKSAQWLDLTNPRFMNWMRISSLPNFRKLWGKINQNLPSGTYTVQIDNNYNVSQFGSKKSLILSTSNFFGSKNTFMSIAYLLMGGFCFLIGLVFLFRKLRNSKRQSKNK